MGKGKASFTSMSLLFSQFRINVLFLAGALVKRTCAQIDSYKTGCSGRYSCSKPRIKVGQSVQLVTYRKGRLSVFLRGL